jgi:hypothetical protein
VVVVVGTVVVVVLVVVVDEVVAGDDAAGEEVVVVGALVLGGAVVVAPVVKVVLPSPHPAASTDKVVSAAKRRVPRILSSLGVAGRPAPCAGCPGVSLTRWPPGAPTQPTALR